MASFTTGRAFEARTFRMALATSLCGSARMCRTAFPCAPRTEPIRSHGLSGL